MLIALTQAACSLVVDRNGIQCKTDNDCLRFANADCDVSRRVCVWRKSVSNQPVDAGGATSSVGTDAATVGADAETDTARAVDGVDGVDGMEEVSGSLCQGPAGCLACGPGTVSGLGNACTDAACVPFDNNARLKNLDSDGGVKPLPALGNSAPLRSFRSPESAL